MEAPFALLHPEHGPEWVASVPAALAREMIQDREIYCAEGAVGRRAYSLSEQPGGTE